MQIFKHTNFANWAEAEGLSDESLKKSVNEISNGLFDANLGSGLYKKRIAAPGKGKRGSFRTILAFRLGDKAFFIYGFKKNEKDNLTPIERQLYRDLAKEYLNLDQTFIRKMIIEKMLIEVK